MQSDLMPHFESLIADLGINSRQDFINRGQEVLDFLPRLCQITEEIISMNNLIE